MNAGCGCVGCGECVGGGGGVMGSKLKLKNADCP